jgi:CoA:oxalate CoA-transferase
VRYFATGEVDARNGSGHPLVAPFQAFTSSDGHVIVAGKSNWSRDRPEWPRLCELIGAPELARDDRFLDNPARLAHRAELEALLNAALARRTTAEWLEILGQEYVVAPLNSVSQMTADPHVRARGMLVDLPAWTGRSFTVSNTPFKLSRTPGGASRGPARAGADTRAILTEVLGLGDAEISALVAGGVVGEPPS